MVISRNGSGRIAAACFLLVLASVMMPVTSASGPLGIYGIVEKVVFEPDDRTPERVQVWGAFAYVERGRSPQLSSAQRGYLYFRLPTFGESVETVRNEWADLEAVAGTRQAVGFGTWGYIGRFEGLRPDARSSMPPYILERRPNGGEPTDLRVRPASEPPVAPAAYQTNTGVVKLSAEGSHAAIVKRLQEALGR
jgi:hypothetical protein